MEAVTTVVVGPDEHGVVRHAMQVADRAGTSVERHRVVPAAPPARPGARVHHWHFTDRLFGATIETAAAHLLAAMAERGGRHVVTLHDVPAPGRDEREQRRAAAYRSLVAAADVAVVASDHERDRLAQAGTPHDRVAVIPLPIGDRGPAAPAACAGRRRVGVLGFVYPGKGHHDVLAAAPAFPPDVDLCVLGRASDGHDDLLIELRRIAASQRRPLEVTGFLADDELARALQRVTVPIVPAREASASASLATWIGAGRRPLVAANGYTTELARRHAGLVTLYGPDQLAAAVRRALDDPAGTFRAGPVPRALGLAATARAHVALYERVLS